MSQPVFRCRVSSDEHISTRIETGELVMVEGEPFVNMFNGLYLTPMTADWWYTRREAELSVLSQLGRLRREIDETIERIKGPLPALDPGSELHSSAAGRAQAEVAK